MTRLLLRRYEDYIDRFGRRALPGVLLLIVILSPLPLASDRQTSSAILSMFTGMTLLVWAFTKLLDHKNSEPLPSLLKWSACLFFIVTFWILVQTWPTTLKSLVHPAYFIVAEEVSLQRVGAISPNAGYTLFSLMLLLTYASIFWLAYQLIRTQAQALNMLKWVSISGGAYALYGLIIYFSGNKWLAFWLKPVYEESLTATFVGRSGAATFFAITLLCQTAWLRQELAPLFATRLSLADKIQEAFGKFWGLTGLIYLSWLLTLPALLLTGARAGAACALIGLMILFLLPIRREKGSVKFLAKFGALALLLLGAALFYSLHGTALQQRLAHMDTGLEDGGRFPIYALVLQAARDAPLTGQGYGSFEYAFPMYKDDTVSGIAFWNMAHNTYLELLFDLGLPALALMLLAASLVIFTVLQSYQSRERKLMPALGLSVIALVSCYALVDFSLQIPAIAALVGLICGAAAVPSSRSRRGSA